MYQENPFITEGYISPEYFCDREAETMFLKNQMLNGCNVALIAQRRLGKSGLIKNMFYQSEIRENFNTFYVDIYETKNMSEFVYELGRSILSVLKSKERKMWEGFIDILHSLNHSITFNSQGLPVWSVKIGDITHPDATLDEIFEYLKKSDKPCIIAIDEFQVLTEYPEQKVEAALRKRIQNCHNVRFIYSGSHRHMMSLIFASPSRPFYNSCTLMGLDPIPQATYLEFVNHHLAGNAKSISKEAFNYLYEEFDGVTWYIQYVMNTLYASPSKEITLTTYDVDNALSEILSRNDMIYSSLLFQFTTKQKQLLNALAEENGVLSIMSQSFLRKHGFSASTVQTTLKYLISHDFVTRDENGVYHIYDRLFAMWLRRKLM